MRINIPCESLHYDEEIVGFMEPGSSLFPVGVMSLAMEWVSSFIAELRLRPYRIFDYMDHWDSIKYRDDEWFDINVFVEPTQNNKIKPGYSLSIDLYSTHLDEEGYVTCNADDWVPLFKMYFKVEDIPLPPENKGDMIVSDGAIQ